MRKLVIGILCSVWLGILSAGAQCAAKNDAIRPGEKLILIKAVRNHV